MAQGDARSAGAGRAIVHGPAPGRESSQAAGGGVLETVVSPFHCLYQDALFFHTQSHLRESKSVPEAGRLARAALTLYVASAEALAHQAAVEIGRPEFVPLLANPARPLPPGEVWRLLPAIVVGGNGGGGAAELASPPWPQFAELLELREAWAYPGPPEARRAYYRAGPDGDFEPVEPRGVPNAPGIDPSRTHLPKTGLPRDPYALRPRHLDTARSVLDAAIEALDRRLGGALTREGRHRKEPCRLL